MEAGTAAKQSTGFEDDRRPDGRRGRAVRRPRRRPPQGRRRLARRHLRRGRRDRPRDRPRPRSTSASQPGERVSHPRATRARSGPTRTSRSPPPAAVVVPIYPTNSPEECEWVAGNSESVGVICEDAEQLAKIVAVRDRLPALRIDGRRSTRRATPAATPSRSTSSASAAATRDAAELEARTAAVAPEDPFTFIYTSGTTGPPKGCVLTHANYRVGLDMCEQLDVAHRRGDRATSSCPLAHAFALLIQLLSCDVGATIAYFGGDTKQIVAELNEVQPDLPAVRAAHLREDLHARARLAAGRRPGAHAAPRRALGVKVRDLQARGEEVAARAARARSTQADERALQERARASSAGSCGRPSRGAAPIAKEILEFFYGCGVPVLEGYGMTETATVATYSTIEQPPLRHRSGALLPGHARAGSPQDGELLLKGANIFAGYYKNDEASVRRDRRRLAAHGRPRLDRRGRLRLHHRAQEGHHHHRGRQEPHAGQPRERPQADALGLAGRHARRPAALPGHARHARRGGDRPLGPRAGDRGHERRGAGRAPARCARSIQAELDRPTPSTRRSSRSSASSSSTTTSRRRPAS